MNKLLIFLFLGIASFGWAQPGTTPVKEVNGKKYYEHKVESGNTLWGLQQAYGVSVEEIVAQNPALKNGLKDGQIVLIPVTQASIAKIPTESYKVKKDETLYGLSKKFNVSVDDLIALNPELKDGLKKGQEIKVPAGNAEAENPTVANPFSEVPNPFVTDTITKTDGSKEQVSFSFSDSTIRHIVMAHETMYSVSKRFMVSVDELMRVNGLKSTTIKEGQILIIPIKQERVDRVEIKPVPSGYDPNGNEPIVFERKEQYTMIMLLPFSLDGGANASRQITDLATRFYMGAKIALDSLEKKGLKMTVRVLDTKNDSATVAGILKDPKTREADLIIGPFFDENFDQVAAFCKMNKIRMVVPSAISSEKLIGNRLVYQAVPSSEDLMESLAEHMLVANANDKIVLVKPEKEADLPLYESFKSSFLKGRHNVTLIESTMATFSSEIARGVNTILVMPTNDRQTAMKFMNALNKVAYKTNPKNLYVYGTKEWSNFSDISNMYKNKYNFTYASPNFLDYYSEPTVKLNRKYREIYRTDLNRLAVHGYDVVNYFCSTFFLPGKKPSCVMTRFELEQISPSDGYMNSGIFVIRQEDYELKDTEAIDD